MDSSTQVLEKHEVPEGTETERLSEYARGVFASLPSRKSVVKAIKREELLVNGIPSSTGYWVQQGDQLTVVENTSRAISFEKKLEVIFEDDFMAAILKPGDLPVSGNMRRTVANALSQNLAPSHQKDRYARPRPVHRLDRQTSGILLIAKTAKSAANLGTQFENRSIKKTYRAVVQGETEKSFSISQSIDDKTAITHFKLLSTVHHNRLGILSELECNPVTGRKNQIRIHLSKNGLPIFGDLKFGGEKSGRGLLLFAESISFYHPESGEQINLSVDVPAKFSRVMRAQKKRPSGR